MPWEFDKLWLRRHETTWTVLHKLGSVIIRSVRERLSGNVETDETLRKHICLGQADTLLIEMHVDKLWKIVNVMSRNYGM